jgi:hypothetical protein
VPFCCSFAISLPALQPRFLTKAERQALALAKLEAQRTGVLVSSWGP